MIGWLILAILVVLLFVFYKARHMKHRIYILLAIIVLIFIYTTGTKIVNQSNLNLNTLEGIVNASKLYFSWLGHAFNNAKVIIGNAIHMDWS